MDRFRQDLRFAIRSLLRNPLVTGAAVASLALGIGANTAIFSAVDAFMLKPLQFEESGNLVLLFTTNEQRGWTSASSSVPDFLDWRRESRTLDMAAYQNVGADLASDGEPERLAGMRVSPGFFSILRKPLALGREFRTDEEPLGAPRAVILSDGLWRRRFGADPAIVGRTIELSDQTWEVVGVARPRVGFGREPDVWMPLQISGDEARNSRFLAVLGRVRDGYSVEEARAELGGIQARLAAAFPAESEGMGATAITLRDDWFDEGFRQGSLIAGTAVFFVLLIACANVANLLLARGAARGREVALRTAIGAGRGMILRQFLTESVLLAIVGGVAALPLAIVGVRGLRGLFPPGMPGIDALVLDGRVFAFMALLTVVAGGLVGLLPAIRQSRGNLRSLITDGGRGTTSAQGGHVRTGLVIAEIGLAVVLLVSSVLLVKAFVGLRTADLGFDIDDRVTFGMTLTTGRYPDRDAVYAFQRTILERFEAIPGTHAVGATNILPMQGGSGRYYVIPDEAPPEPGREPVIQVRYVSPGYFAAMGIPVDAGRSFTAADDGGAQTVAIVNHRFAARHWPDESPVGRRIRFAGVDHEIVGVARDTHDFGPDDDAEPLVFLPLLQNEARTFDIVLHTGLTPAAAIGAVREVVATMDSRQPVYEINTLRGILEDNIGGSLAMTKVLGALALIAFLLSGVGIYGVMAYTVAQRTQEVGIRMALGAQPRDVLGLILRRGLFMTGLGVTIGLLISLGVTRMLAFFLFGVSPFDLTAFGSVPLALGLTGLIASLLPARRAAGVDPLVSLRSD
jgi:putative ABC transport system permease protein